MNELGATSKRKDAPTSYVMGAILYVLADFATTAARKVFSIFSNRAGNRSRASKKRGRYERRVHWHQNVWLWLPLVIVISIMLIGFVTARVDKKPDAEKIFFMEPTSFIETISETEAETSSLDEEAVALARLADSVAKGRSDEVKRIIMWVAINRSEDRCNGYGRSLLEEISRPKQWQQYNENSSYLESTLALAEDVLDTWRSMGPRPIYSDMLWFILNGDGSITVRNQFKVGKNRSEITFGQ